MTGNMGTGKETRRMIFIHTPNVGASPSKDLGSCLNALGRDLYTRGLPRKAVLKLTFFLRAENGCRRAELKRELFPEVDDFFSSRSPSIIWVAQPPEGTAWVAMEAVMLMSFEGVRVERRKWEGHAYVVLSDPPYKVLYAGGLGDRTPEPGIEAASREGFGSLRKLLRREEMSFSNIVRQWNYIGGILSHTEKEKRQHYQIFNDIRARYYGADRFECGFPAATGIGQNSRGVIIDCIAVRGNGSGDIVALGNPGQVDAHRYSQDVLVGGKPPGSDGKVPPQFERGKILWRRNRGMIYVSGTASIVGEKTVGKGDVIRQTRTTIANITRLVSPGNLTAPGAAAIPVPGDPAGFRVYVKHEEDIPCVKAVCRDSWGDAPMLFVQADICRRDLLVEIEGMLYVKLNNKIISTR